MLFELFEYISTSGAAWIRCRGLAPLDPVVFSELQADASKLTAICIKSRERFKVENNEEGVNVVHHTNEVNIRCTIYH